jgi:hypothetical protein
LWRDQQLLFDAVARMNPGDRPSAYPVLKLRKVRQRIYAGSQNVAMPAVRVMEVGLEWVVWLEGNVVGHFALLGDALSYAALLECSPRARTEALR